MGYFQRSIVGTAITVQLLLCSILMLFSFAWIFFRHANVFVVAFYTAYMIRCVIIVMLTFVPIERRLVRMLPGLLACFVGLLRLIDMLQFHQPRGFLMHTLASHFLGVVIGIELLNFGFWLPPKSTLSGWTTPFYWKAEEGAFCEGPVTIYDTGYVHAPPNYGMPYAPHGSAASVPAFVHSHSSHEVQADSAFVPPPRYTPMQ